ncbi:glycosyltransferase family 39 protein [uncultured Phocaeicola sp.]|jgi:4-amino-4-deoxy-L-arabinose transferase-like glycosyltransferase|uniref:ArnT family glycosyltransferase n=1 Tax=uncultured Phocaeicola sp. TaxID=990718 RepID=UPI0025E7E76E|nr:glycosyltransferase family 39 protein [uncultured Phocaeicola sp.]
MKKQEKYAWLLAALCVVGLFLFLGESLFNTRGEPREAVVALSMLQDGNWILPVNNGVDMAYKPPLFHWCIALFSTVAGGVSEYTSRMPSAVALALMVLGGYGFYARRRGSELAFLMGLITLTNFEVHRAGTNCRVDMLLSALMVLALYQLYRWGEKGLKGVPWTGILCLSGAFLTKGPVGMALPCLVVAVFLWIRGMKFGRIFLSFLGVGLASCVLPLAWYVAAYRQGGDEFLQLVLEENVYRLLGKMSYESHENPAYYNLITVIAGYVPYTLLVLISLFALKYRKWSGKPAAWWNRFRAYVRKMDDVRLFSLLSIVLIFVFYCIPKSKRSVYLLPVYPFLAYFLAEYLVYLTRRHVRVMKIFGSVMAVLAGLLLVVFFSLRMGWIPDSIFSGSHADQNIAFKRALESVPLGIVSWILLLLMAGSIVWFVSFLKKGKSAVRLPYAVIGVIVAIFLGLDGIFQPAVLNVKSDKPIAERIASIVPEGKLYSYRTDITPGNRMHPFTINFYLGDRVVPFDVFEPQKGFLIVGNAEIEDFKEAYPAYQVEEVFDSGHRSCDDHKIIHFYRFWKHGE